MIASARRFPVGYHSTIAHGNRPPLSAVVSGLPRAGGSKTIRNRSAAAGDGAVAVCCSPAGSPLRSGLLRGIKSHAAAGTPHPDRCLFFPPAS